ncbi:MAG: hypothetical protein PHW60_10555 [Kiritimatiellae bacterium]|nr:hypothetical protein [Kiritimatiellia bacterium]
MNNEWLRVSRYNPCRICHKPDWCGYSETAACCMRVKSDSPARNGGWIHRLSDPIPDYHRPPPRDDVLRPCFYTLWRVWRDKTDPGLLDEYAKALVVSEQVLNDLGAAWAPEHGAWAFPMRDSAGKIDGIRLRADSGRKWAVTGSHQGVFMSLTWPSATDIALICEGPTDTAAAMSIGFMAIGRPSCLGCERHISDIIKLVAVRRVVIVADNDGPGLAGANKLAGQLKVPWKIIVPPTKDLRAWVRMGATKALVECVINQMLWRNI